MLYDAALVHFFRILIQSKGYRWCAQTGVGIWLTGLMERWIECASHRIRARRPTVTDRLFDKIIELETHVQQMRAELNQLKKTTKKR